MRRLVPILLGVGLLPGLLTGCGDGGAGTGWMTTTDTLPSGVPRVVNIPPEAGIRTTWRVEEELRIGSLEGEDAAVFGQIKGFGVLPDGRIAVLEAQAQEVRIFAPGGAHLVTHGGKGAGPGEFAAANGLVVGGDGLIRVHDPRNARLTLLHPDSGAVGAERLEIRSWGWIWSPAMDSLDRIYDETTALVDGEPWHVVKVLGPRGRWEDTIRRDPIDRGAAAADPSVFVYSGGRVIQGFHPVPFWPELARAMDPPTGWWTKPAHENVYRIAHTTFAGDTLLVLESRRPARPVSAAERDSAIAAVRERTGQQHDWSRVPAQKPVVERLFLDRGGRLWVQVGASDSLTTFDVFSRDGAYAGTAETALTVHPMLHPIVDGDRFHAVVTDAMDVQYIVRGRLVPASAAPSRRPSDTSAPSR